MHNNKRVSTKRLLARQKQMDSPHSNRSDLLLNEQTGAGSSASVTL
jgi:hypothetical protein